MKRVIVVPGTWGRSQDWYRPVSPWARYLAVSCGVEVFEPAGRPFLWSTDVAGWQFWRRWGLGARDGDMWDWQAGGAHLLDLLVPPLAPERRMSPADTWIVSHSHGRQVVLYALSFGLKVDRWIDVSGPVRADLADVQARGAENLNVHIHTYSSDWSDRMQRFGAIGDGLLGRVAADPRPGVVNHRLDGAGHSGVLREVAWFPLWNQWLG